MGALRGRCIVGTKVTYFCFDDWLPCATTDILIGVNPDKSLLNNSKKPNDVLWDVDWTHEGQSINLIFVPPPDTRVQPVIDWHQNTNGSSSLYPWWCSFEACWQVPVDLICQIHPRGASTEHKHQEEVGIEIAEEFGPVWNDGKTMLKRNDGPPKPLVGLERILPGQTHQIIRDAPGFSIQLLLMRSRKYRFPDRRGHIICR